MKIYTLSKKQFLPIPLLEAWNFFSSPETLPKISPDNMNIQVEYMSGAGMYPGQIVRYRVQLLPFLRIAWTAEITHVAAPNYFVDNQRSGPYAMWHHQHHFKEVPGGTEMTDEVNYAMPFGWLGRLAHRLFVRRKLDRIFAGRFQKLEQLFKKI